MEDAIKEASIDCYFLMDVGEIITPGNRVASLAQSLHNIKGNEKLTTDTLLCLIVGGGVTLQFFENFDPHFILL